MVRRYELPVCEKRTQGETIFFRVLWDTAVNSPPSRSRNIFDDTIREIPNAKRAYRESAGGGDLNNSHNLLCARVVSNSPAVFFILQKYNCGVRCYTKRVYRIQKMKISSLILIVGTNFFASFRSRTRYVVLIINVFKNRARRISDCIITLLCTRDAVRRKRGTTMGRTRAGKPRCVVLCYYKRFRDFWTHVGRRWRFSAQCSETADKRTGRDSHADVARENGGKRSPGVSVRIRTLSRRR